MEVKRDPYQTAGHSIERRETRDRSRPRIGKGRVLLWAAAGVIVILILVSTAYVRDMHRARERIRDKSSLITSPYGNIEFIQGGSGPPVLVIHGSGGGYDQGELLAEAVLGDEFQWIAPSRFGYLRSTFREGATFDDQAHAYAHLLDELGVEKVAVVTMSHGGPSALLFAAATIARARLLSCDKGGHLLMVIEQAGIRAAMQKHILDHSSVPVQSPPSP